VILDRENQTSHLQKKEKIHVAKAQFNHPDKSTFSLFLSGGKRLLSGRMRDA
jgi:hypothetical protein